MSSIQPFQQLVMTAQRAIAVTPIDHPKINQTVQAIEHYFRNQILAIAIDPDPHQAIHVEINKQLRLLRTDLLFLRSAQQADTQAQRLGQMRDRLTLLERYCEMILGES
jgi:hypothetical protein